MSSVPFSGDRRCQPDVSSPPYAIYRFYVYSFCGTHRRVVLTPLFPSPICASCSHQQVRIYVLFIFYACLSITCASFLLPALRYNWCWFQQGSKSNVVGERPAKKAKFDGGYASTMQGAEAFFNKPSPFQKAAQEKEEAAAAATAAASAGASAATDAESVDARVLDPVDSAETASETTTVEVGICRLVCHDA